MGSAALGSLFATGDAALSALTEARLAALAQGEGPSAEAFRRYAKDSSRVLSRWLVGRVLCISLAAALVDEVVEDTATLSGFGVLFAVLVSVVAYGTLTEILSTIARRRPEPTAALALRLLGPVGWCFAPLAEPLALLGRFIERRFPLPSTDAEAAESEVEWVVNQGERAGAIGNAPAEIIRNVLDFKDLIVKEVMVPRRRVVAFEVGTSLREVMGRVTAAGHSRFPVYRETLDNVVGLLYTKDLIRVARDGKADGNKLTDVARSSLLFVAETQPAESVLREMRAKGLHVAIVADEFGGTSGIVTLGDILEEIVGGIREHDRAPRVERIGEARFVADAAVSLSDLSDLLGRALPADGDFESLGGLLVHRAGRVPEVGSELKLDGLRFVVREAEDTHVVKVEIDTSGANPVEAAGSAS